MLACLNSCAAWHRRLTARYLRPWVHSQARTWKACSVGRKKTTASMPRLHRSGYSGLIFRRWLLRVSWDVLSTTDFLFLIYFLAKRDSAPRLDERDAAKRRKTHRTLAPWAKFLILNGLPVRCFLISKHRLGEADFTVLKAGCQAKSLDSCPINEKLFCFQAQNVQIKNSYKEGSA